MDCPQCGAKVPSDDLFCGKCGYAMRDHGPERVDQSRIRVHEEPDPVAEAAAHRTSSQQRIRKHTVLGMPSATRPAPSPASTATPPPPPPPRAPVSSARSGRTATRTSQKTMLGIPRPDFPEPPGASSSAEPPELDQRPPSDDESGATSEPATPSHRARARVRYDSANEPYSMMQRRRRALGGLAVLVLLAAAWLGYRVLMVNGY